MYLAHATRILKTQNDILIDVVENALELNASVLSQHANMLDAQSHNTKDGK